MFSFFQTLINPSLEKWSKPIDHQKSIILPDELILKILENLDQISLFQSSLVNKQFYRCSRDIFEIKKCKKEFAYDFIKNGMYSSFKHGFDLAIQKKIISILHMIHTNHNLYEHCERDILGGAILGFWVNDEHYFLELMFENLSRIKDGGCSNSYRQPLSFFGDMEKDLYDKIFQKSPILGAVMLSFWKWGKNTGIDWWFTIDIKNRTIIIRKIRANRYGMPSILGFENEKLTIFNRYLFKKHLKKIGGYILLTGTASLSYMFLKRIYNSKELSDEFIYLTMGISGMAIGSVSMSLLYFLYV